MKILIIGAIIAIISLYFTWAKFKDCDGRVVRGVVGLICIKDY